MLKKIHLVTTAFVLLLIGMPLAAQEPEPTNLFVIETEGGLPTDLDAMVSASGGVLIRTLAPIHRAIAQSDDPAFAATLESYAEIRRCSPDFIVQWTPPASIAAEQVLALDDDDDETPPPDVPPAVFASCQWHFDRIDMDRVLRRGQVGDRSIKVAVLDGGVDQFHQDLAGKIDLVNSASVIGAPTICDNFAPDQTSFQDFNFHGSFVAALIAANGIGINGVAPEVEIVGIKVLSCLGSGTFGDLLSGIVLAASIPGVEVMNMSLGALLLTTPDFQPLFDAVADAVDFATDQGVLVVSSAGNEAINFDANPLLVHVPSMVANSMSISATTIDDQLASFSNAGLVGADIGAPGGDFPNPAAPLEGCAVNPPIPIADAVGLLEHLAHHPLLQLARHLRGRGGHQLRITAGGGCRRTG